MEKLVEYFKDTEVKNILDVGTGTGDFLAVLKKTFPLAKITGVDPNLESIGEAEKLFPEVTFEKMYAENLSFQDHTFDLVSISMALHHLPEIEKAFAEMLRVLKPGGWIIVSELFSDNLNAAQEVHKMFHHFRSKTDRILGVSHNETFPKNEIIEMVKNAGINIQYHFEFKKGVDLITTTEALDSRVEKMKAMLDSVKDYPEYEKLKPQIDEFRERASKHGFQPATRVVVVGKGQ
jgi:ubiquinone/menaquinone biosynthesis C-methylase UbiE